MRAAKENSGYVIFLPPSLEHTVVKQFYALVEEAMKLGETEVIVDASDLTFLDSMGIGYLVRASKDLKDKGGDLKIRNLQGDPLNLFQQTSLINLFTIYDGDQVQAAKENLFEQAVDLKLEIAYERRAGVGILHMTGMMSCPDDARRFKECILLNMTETNRFLVDMENLTYLDSISVGGVIRMAHILSSSGGMLRICNANELVSQLFKTLHAGKLIPLFPSIEEALREW